MRKFCSTCGGQLELSKRFCTECGAVNPFFVSAFSLLGDQSGELERLRIEKERIERELYEKEQAHAEFLKQEQLKKQLEELERQKRENLERERIERERMEEDLKKEISRVKEESEAYKKKTIGLLKEIQEQLQQKIEEENKNVVEPVIATPVETDGSAAPEPEKIVASPPPAARNSGGKNMTVILFLLIGGVALAGITYYKLSSSFPKEISAVSKTPEFTSKEPSREDTLQMDVISKTAIDSIPIEMNTVSTNVSTLATPTRVKTSPAEAVTRTKTKTDFSLTPFRLKADLIGKSLSGCDIVIRKLSEINQVKNLVLVERMPSGYLKYKLEMRVVQGNEIYTATPYVYYTSAGRFLKIDGTNCE